MPLGYVKHIKLVCQLNSGVESIAERMRERAKSRTASTELKVMEHSSTKILGKYLIAIVCVHISSHAHLEICKFARSTREEKFLNFLL